MPKTALLAATYAFKTQTSCMTPGELSTSDSYIPSPSSTTPRTTSTISHTPCSTPSSTARTISTISYTPTIPTTTSTTSHSYSHDATSNSTNPRSSFPQRPTVQVDPDQQWMVFSSLHAMTHRQPLAGPLSSHVPCLRPIRPWLRHVPLSASPSFTPTVELWVHWFLSMDTLRATIRADRPAHPRCAHEDHTLLQHIPSPTQTARAHGSHFQMGRLSPCEPIIFSSGANLQVPRRTSLDRRDPVVYPSADHSEPLRTTGGPLYALRGPFPTQH
jgi:hypothetical protein